MQVQLFVILYITQYLTFENALNNRSMRAGRAAGQPSYSVGLTSVLSTMKAERDHFPMPDV